MKKVMGYAVLAVSVIIGAVLICFQGNAAHLSHNMVDMEQFGKIVKEHTAVEGLLEALYFDEQLLFYDSTCRTFYYSLIEGSSSAYDPVIMIKGKEKDLKIAFLTNGITAEGIKSNQEIKVLAYTNDTYCEYSLKCTTLPLINIDCSEIISDEDVAMQMTVFDNRQAAANRVTISEGTIHVRGASTRGYPKKGYRFSLTQESVGGNSRPNDVSLLGMRQDDDWLLYAAYNDQEKIRNVFSSNLWYDTCAADNAYGIIAGMEYRYTELFVNGGYWGLYALGYPIDRKQMQMDTDSTTDALYKIVNWTDARGLKSVEGGRFEGYDVKGVDDGRAAWMPLIKYYDNLYLYSGDNKKLYAGIDINNAIDVYLFFNLIQGCDNVAGLTGYYSKNQYLSIREVSDGLMALYAPWDMDISWGAYGMTPEFNCIMESGYLNQIIENGDDTVWKMILNKYWDLRENGWSDKAINILLDKYELEIYGSGAFLRDMQRWPDGEYGNAAEELKLFRAYVMERLQEADLYYRRMELLAGDSIFVRRSAQYKDFCEHTFYIEINNKDLLKDPDYIDLFEYIGISMDAVTDEVCLIHAKPAEGIFEYLSASEKESTAQEAAEDKQDINMMFTKDGKEKVFDFTREPEVPGSRVTAFTDATFYLLAMYVMGYQAIVEINNSDIWQDPAYAQLFESLGVEKGTVSENTDFVVLDGADKTAMALDYFHRSGSQSDTPIGALSLFANEQGIYGVYLDNRECFTSSEHENEGIDIRILLLDSDSHEIMDCVFF